MTYKQHSIYGYTGNVESVKNRIANNGGDSNHSEVVEYPDKFDLFTNKENASVGGYSVTENHATADIVGNKLYLDHRLFVDATGGYIAPTVSDGSLDLTTIDIFQSTVEFSTLPTLAAFNVTYTARSDKIQDSHINATQNALMKVQQILGIKAPVGGVGTGMLTMETMTQFRPRSQAAIDGIKANVMPNIVLAGDLEEDLRIAGTDNAALDSYGGSGVTILIGNPGPGAKDVLRLSADSLEVNRNIEGNLYFGMTTGSYSHFSGCTDFASQVTIGLPHAGKGDYQGVIPSSLSGFYNDAMLRVNGGIYFGAGMSGNGAIVFVTQTGEKVDIVGDLEATNFNVEAAATFNGNSQFKGEVDVSYPGYLTTDADIVLRDRNDVPSLIDGLDPSYAEVAIESNAQVNNTVSTYHWNPTFSQDNMPYVSGAKSHPVHNFDMYPVIGGWTFTGQANFAKATFHSHKQVLLLSSSLRNATGLTYGEYSEGLFNPGDSHIEINDGGNAKVSYPIYFHEAFQDGTSLTGLNVFVSADDDVLTNPSIINQNYRIFQPSNAPVYHVSSDFSTPTAPTATFGNAAGGHYSDNVQRAVEFKTDPAFVGPSIGQHPEPLFKRLSNNDTIDTSLLEALQRSVDNEQINATTSWGAVGEQIGVAYLFAGSDSKEGTKHAAVKFKASPSPYGISTANTWGGAGLNMNPGQWTLVGEVVASSTNGTSWTEIETTSYRPNAFYDSCWIPMVQYRDASMASPYDVLPSDLGRCLPILGSEAGSGGSKQFALGEGNHNFFVEHNIGPVRSLTEVSVRVFIATPAAGGIGTSAGSSWYSIFREAAGGTSNLQSPYAMPYNGPGVHNFYKPASATGTGFFKEITSGISIRMFDPRFCRIGISDSATLKDINSEDAAYIRVIIKRTR